jgi:myo-inositol-1(or 4)-monophosphatase
MQPLVNLALRAARNAGQDLVRSLDRFDPYQSSDQEKSKFVADCAIGLEKSIIFELKKACPEDSYQGRETGFHSPAEGTPRNEWQICVIDDLVNFRVGLPDFAIIVSCLVNGKTEHTVVLNPMNGDEFSASRGRGAQLNNRRLRCGQLREIGQALIGFKTPNHTEGEHVFEIRSKISNLMTQANDVRALGSSVLMMAYTAADRLNGAMLCDMDEFSLNAGSLIAHEAGCLTANLSGQALIKAPADIWVANPRLLKELIQKV